MSFVKQPTQPLSPLDSLPTSSPGPTPLRARITTLDVLRGFALLGILIVNIETFGGPESLHDIPVGTALPAFVGWHAHLDLIILTLKWLFVEGKMRALFSALFGAGAILLTERIERSSNAMRTADIFLRRNLWLLLFGLIHGVLIWEGDILRDYALAGLLFLYPVRFLSSKKLIGIGLAITLLGGTLGLLNFVDARTVLREDTERKQAFFAISAGQTATPEQRRILQGDVKAAEQTQSAVSQQIHDQTLPYLQEISGRAEEYFGFLIKLFHSGYEVELIGNLLLGMGLYKIGFFSGRLQTKVYALVMLLGYGITFPVVLLGVLHASSESFSLAAVTRWMVLPYELAQVAGMIGNAAVVILIVRFGLMKPITRALQAVGRTAFSNYILTSLACQFYFVWGPWKEYGRLEYYQELYVVGIIWLFNLTLSTMWLRYFAYGPLEWAWRSLTYWRRQPFRLEA